MHTDGERNTYRADIEGLRAVAVLAVVAFHFGFTPLQGGFVGVDVFFVISGYLITGILLAEIETTADLDLWRFYGRRARRLLPASLLVAVTTLGIGLVVLAPTEQLFAAKGALASSLYASNFWFMTFSTDYFAPESALNPFLHTWSLAVEEQFYLVWPTLLLLLWRFRPNVRFLALVLGGLAAISLVLCVWLTMRKQPWAFYASPSRAWEFAIGALAVLRPVTRWALRSPLAVPLGWTGIALLGASLFLLGEEVRFPGWIALLPAVSAVAVIVSGASGKEGGPATFLKLPLMQWVGRHSYSIYLWHWPIVVYVSIVGMANPVTKAIFCSVMTVACAAMSFRWLEHPVRSSPWLAKRPFRSIGLGVSLTLAGAAIAILVAQAAMHFSRAPDQASLLQWAGEPPVASGSGNNCLVGFLEKTPVLCSFGPADPSRTVVLFGDSHADQWSTPLVKLAETRGWRLVTVLKSSCAVSEIPTYNVRLRRFSPECTQWRSRAMAEIGQLKPDLVIIAQFSSGYIKGSVTTLGENAVSHEQWSDGLRSSVVQLRAMDLPVVLLRDSPSPGRNVNTCLARLRWRGLPGSSCDTPREEAIDQRVSSIERQLAAATPGVHAIDLSDRFCTAEVCPALLTGVLVYRDANHLTTALAGAQMSALGAALREIVGF